LALSVAGWFGVDSTVPPRTERPFSGLHFFLLGISEPGLEESGSDALPENPVGVIFSAHARAGRLRANSNA
jgi:hypothetical protein